MIWKRVTVGHVHRGHSKKVPPACTLIDRALRSQSAKTGVRVVQFLPHATGVHLAGIASYSRLHFGLADLRRARYVAPPGHPSAAAALGAPPVRRAPGTCRALARTQTWQTFLVNHVQQVASVDYFTVPTATFRVLSVLVVSSHNTGGPYISFQSPFICPP